MVPRKHPTSKDNEGYMDQKLWGIVYVQTRQCPKCEIPKLLGIRPALLGLWSFKATGCAFCADYGSLTFMEVPSMRGTAPLAPRTSFTMN